MKRTLAFLLVLLLLPAAALANSWGLKGDLLTAVSSDSAWNDYTSGDQVGNVATMRSRYHYALMHVAGKKQPLQVYTRAMWQPTDHKDFPQLTKSGSGFILSYGDREGYTFLRDEDGQYLLYRAEFRDENGRVRHYRHHETWHDDNGSSHIHSLIMSPFITIPFVNGRITIGPWQGAGTESLRRS